MNIQIKRDEIFPIISQVQGILEKKTLNPIQAYILLNAEKTNLKIFASGGELSFLGQISCSTKVSGRVAINGKGFFDILREISSGKLNLKEENNRRIKIETENSKFHIFGLNPEDFPVFPPIEIKKFQKIPIVEFLDLIEKILYCVSLDEARYHLTGAFCECLSDSFVYRFAATDSHRMAFFDLFLGKKGFVPFKEGVIIPRKGLQEIKRLIHTSDDEEAFEFAVEKSRAVVKFKDQILFIRLIDGQFPNYKALIPKDKGTEIVLEREEFLSALRKVSVLTNDRYKAVNFKFQEKTLYMEVSVPEVGEAKSHIPCSYKKNQEIKVRFNSRYILDIINVLNEKDVEISIRKASEPGVIKGKGSKNYTSVVMPMVLSKSE